MIQIKQNYKKIPDTGGLVKKQITKPKSLKQRVKYQVLVVNYK